MVCERCKKRESTIHLTEIIKDIKSEIHLCEECAREIGLNSKISSFTLTIPEMLSFLDTNEMDDINNDAVCLNCGMSYIEYSREGKLGCPDCYVYLADSLRSPIVSYHSNDRHIGKFPRFSDPDEMNNNISKFKKEEVEVETYDILIKDLEEAVSSENYEKAAVLRDKIRKLQ